jgi:hypothetical protein
VEEVEQQAGGEPPRIHGNHALRHELERVDRPAPGRFEATSDLGRFEAVDHRSLRPRAPGVHVWALYPAAAASASIRTRTPNGGAAGAASGTALTDARARACAEAATGMARRCTERRVPTVRGGRSRADRDGTTCGVDAALASRWIAALRVRASWLSERTTSRRPQSRRRRFRKSRKALGLGGRYLRCCRLRGAGIDPIRAVDRRTF